MQIRYYGDKLSKRIAKTPEGFLICQDVPISRTGYQDYLASEIMENPRNGDKIIHVYRPAEEVFNFKSIASFEGKPVTNEHPDEDVTPDNYQQYACGHVQNVHPGEGPDKNKVLADLYITDPGLINSILNGKREISCGYYAEEKRDSTGKLCQTKIRGNHVAVVNSGRAGSTVCIRDHKRPLCHCDEDEYVMRHFDYGVKGMKYGGPGKAKPRGKPFGKGNPYRFGQDSDETDNLFDSDDYNNQGENSMYDEDIMDEDILDEDTYVEDLEDDDEMIGDDLTAEDLFEDDDEVLDDDIEDDDEFADEDVLDDDELMDDDEMIGDDLTAEDLFEDDDEIVDEDIEDDDEVLDDDEIMADDDFEDDDEVLDEDIEDEDVIDECQDDDEMIGDDLTAEDLFEDDDVLDDDDIMADEDIEDDDDVLDDDEMIGDDLTAEDLFEDDDEIVDEDIEDDDEVLDECQDDDEVLDECHDDDEMIGDDLTAEDLFEDDDLEDDDDEIMADEDFEDDDEVEVVPTDEVEAKTSEGESTLDTKRDAAIREIMNATREVTDPVQRKKLQDTIYHALCGKSQMKDIMRITQRNARAKHDSIITKKNKISMENQQAIYDSFNPHKHK